MATEEVIRELKRRYSPKLLILPGVSGVGIEKDDSGEYVLVVHLDADNSKARKGLPDEIEGHSIKYIQSGPYKKQPASGKA